MNATRIKKAGKAVAGSALLVGATLTGAAGLAAASSHNSGSSGDMSGDMSLADYPAPFIGEDGTVNTAIVVGEQAATIDVVGAINIAGSLGNQAFDTEMVSAEGGSFGFSASDGVTLDTRNDQIYFGDSIDEVRSTLTDQQLDVMATTDALTGDEEQEVEQFLYLGSQDITFGNPGDADDEDPEVYVDIPDSIDVTNSADYLYRVQANFEEGVNFQDTSEDDNKNDDVYNEEIEMFGQTFTVGDDSFSEEEGLVLYGSQQTFDIGADQDPRTIEIGGEEVTVELTGVTSEGEAILNVNNQRVELSEDESADVNGEELRALNIDNFAPEDTASDLIELGVGSQEILLEDGNEIQRGTGSDSEDIDGTDVQLEGQNIGSGDVSSDDVQLSTIEIAFGAEDSDEGYLMAGDMYENPVFEDLDFRFGGLNPDTVSEDRPDTVEEVEQSTSGDDVGTISFTADGDDTSLDLFFEPSPDDGDDDVTLADEDEDEVVVAEGAAVDEDDYVLADAGDFSHVFEVTGIDRDETSDIQSDDEATIELSEVGGDTTIDVELDARDGADDSFNSGTDDDYYAGSEVIDGQTYTFVLEGEDDTDVSDQDDSDGNEVAHFRMAYGGVSESQVTGLDPDSNDLATINTGDRTTLFAAKDTSSRAAVSLAREANATSFDLEDVDTNGDGSVDDTPEELASETFELPSTESTDAETVTAAIYDERPPGVDLASGNDNPGDSVDFYVKVEGADAVGNGDDATWIDLSGDDTGFPHDTVEFTAGQVNYQLDVDTPGDETSVTNPNSDPDVTLDVGVSSDQDSDLQPWNTGGESNDDELDLAATALTILPEDEEDNEQAYVHTFSDQSGDDGIQVDNPVYTGSNRVTNDLESNDDVTAFVDFYGTYGEYDSEDAGGATLYVPSGQAVAGAAVTGPQGSLDTGGGSGSVESQTPTGFGQEALLDSEVTSSQRQNTNHILVGGPAVNDLVSTLVDQGEADVPRAGASPPGVTPADGNATGGNATDGNATDGGATEGTTETYGEGDAAIQLVEDSFADGANSLIVAGFTGEDTRQAANRLANADENPLPGQDRFTVETGQ